MDQRAIGRLGGQKLRRTLGVSVRRLRAPYVYRIIAFKQACYQFGLPQIGICDSGNLSSSLLRITVFFLDELMDCPLS